MSETPEADELKTLRRAHEDACLAFTGPTPAFAAANDRFTEALASLRQRQEEAQTEREEARKRTQCDVDAIVHYRNLAIMCGAKPENMLNEWDRNLCERGITPDEHAYDPYNAIEDLAEEWDKASLRTQLQQAETALAAIRDVEPDEYGYISAPRLMAIARAALAAPPPNPKEGE